LGKAAYSILLYGVLALFLMHVVDKVLSTKLLNYSLTDFDSY